MDFVFTAFEIGIVFMANVIVALISQDGRSDWLEGAQLLGAYCIVGAAAFFVGTLG
jgi:Ca2+:H+ antiporter